MTAGIYKSVAALFAALVEALDEKNTGIAAAVTRHLEATQLGLRQDGEEPDVVETLGWTLDLLRRDLDRAEPAAVVYAKAYGGGEPPLPSAEKVQFRTLDEALLFWSRLPDFDRSHASIETARGRRYEAPDVGRLLTRYGLTG